MHRHLEWSDGASGRHVARLPGLAKLAGLGRRVRIIATIVCGNRNIHHDLHALFHWTGLLERVRDRDALEGNRETKQEGNEYAHRFILSEKIRLPYELTVRFLVRRAKALSFSRCEW